MVHEARGLDVAHVAHARFMRENPPDTLSAAILESNVKDETGHVGYAVKWFTYLCHHVSSSSYDTCILLLI
jgi:uncharacterized ferritin-like protein (DUF455 family)